MPDVEGEIRHLAHVRIARFRHPAKRSVGNALVLWNAEGSMKLSTILRFDVDAGLFHEEEKGTRGRIFTSNLPTLETHLDALEAWGALVVELPAYGGDGWVCTSGQF